MAQDPKADEMDAVQRAWQSRQDRASSASFELVEDRTTHVDYFRIAIPDNKDAWPSKDQMIPFAHSFLLSGSKLRYEYKGKQWSPVHKKLQRVEYVGIIDDVVQSSLYSYPEGGRHPEASRKPRTAASDNTVVTLAPIMLAIRGADEQIAGPRHMRYYEFSGKNAIISGRRCVELIKGSRTENQRDFMYLDAQRDYILLRNDTYTGDKLVFRMTIDYAPEASIGWAPVAWTFSSRSPRGDALDSGAVKVKDFRINLPVPDGVFRPVYPPGTAVVDQTGSSGALVAYVVNREGESRAPLPVSSTLTYEKLLQANEGASALPSKAIAIGVCSVLLAVAVGILVWRVRSRTSHT